MQSGIIIKGISGFYYVKTNNGVIECKARGRFRKDTITPLVGDRVILKLTEHDRTKGSIEEILPRSTQLIRPPVANVNQLLMVLAVHSPEPNLLMLDKLIVESESKTLIYFVRE